MGNIQSQPHSLSTPPSLPAGLPQPHLPVSALGPCRDAPHAREPSLPETPPPYLLQGKATARARIKRLSEGAPGSTQGLPALGRPPGQHGVREK